MEDRWKTTLILCLYGFFKEVRPSEPYLAHYLISNYTGVTENEVYHNVYPLWTYSYLAVLVPVFLFTDFLKYKPVIIIEAMAYITTWVLLIWGYGLPSMQIMKCFFGIASSTEVAYFTYIYAKVSSEHYQQVTSLTRTALLIGRFLSGLLSQVLISSHLLSYRELNYISLSMVSAAGITSLFLPPVTATVYFHRNDGDEGASQKNPSIWKSLTDSFRLLYTDFIAAYSNPYVLKWSLWWALGTCGYFQVGNYIQPLWEDIKSENGTVCQDEEGLNGAVEATASLTGAVLATLLGFLYLNWALIGDFLIAVISVLDAVMLYMIAKAINIWTTYAGYLIFRASYQMMMTIASFEVAKHINPSSYGLVFGVNIFMALLFQSALTAVVADNVGLHLPHRDQYVVYAGFYAVVAALYFLLGLIGCFRHGKTRYLTEGLWLRRKSKGEEADKTSRTDCSIGNMESRVSTKQQKQI